MEYIIGRESGVDFPRLCIRDGEYKYYYGSSGSVPQSVSRCHCCILEKPDGKFLIRNLSDHNVLYVNGVEYKEILVEENDVVELGPERYRINLGTIVDAVRAERAKRLKTGTNSEDCDISELKKVWTDYNQAKLNIQIRERKFNALSTIPGVISMISIALSFIEGLRALFISVSALSAIVFAIIRIKNAENVPIKQKELDEKFQDEYICPRCGHFLGNQRYELLLRNGSCPWCKAAFKE